MPSGTKNKLTVSYKLLLFSLLGVLGMLVLARIVLAIAVPNPTPSLIECMRDLTRWIECVLAAFLGFLGGRAAH